jgi:hypothetical protein
MWTTGLLGQDDDDPRDAIRRTQPRDSVLPGGDA